MTLNDAMVVILRYFSEFAYLTGVLRKSSRSLFAVARPSVVCRLSVCHLSSVTFVRPTQAVQILGNISTAFGTLAIVDVQENFTEIVPGEPIRRGS